MSLFGTKPKDASNRVPEGQDIASDIVFPFTFSLKQREGNPRYFEARFQL
jgi:hypothetical protein